MANGEYIDIKVVVDQVELLPRRERACGTVDLARELVVGRVEFVLPYLYLSINEWVLTTLRGVPFRTVAI